MRDYKILNEDMVENSKKENNENNINMSDDERYKTQDKDDFMLVEGNTNKILVWFRKTEHGVFKAIVTSRECYQTIRENCICKDQPTVMENIVTDFLDNIIEFNSDDITDRDKALNFVFENFTDRFSNEINMRLLTVQKEDFCKEETLNFYGGTIHAVIYYTQNGRNTAMATINKFDGGYDYEVFDYVVDELHNVELIPDSADTLEWNLDQIKDFPTFNQGLKNKIDAFNDWGYNVALHCDDECVVFMFQGEKYEQPSIDHEIQNSPNMWEDDDMDTRENEIVLVDNKSGRILAWVKDDTFGKFSIITTGDLCYDTIEEYCLDKTNPRETRYRFSRLVVEFNNNGFEDFADVMAYLNKTLLDVDKINMDIKAMTIQEEDYCTEETLYHSDRIDSVVYLMGKAEYVAVADINIARDDSLSANVKIKTFDRNIDELKEHGFIDKGFDISTILNEIDVNGSISSLEDVIDELNDEGFSVMTYADEDGCAFLFPGDWIENCVVDDDENNNEEGDDCMKGFAIVRKDNKDVVLFAYISEKEDRAYDYFINNIYLVNRRFTLSDEDISSFKATVKSGETLSLYEMTENLNKLEMFSGEDAVEIEPLNKYEGIVPSCAVNVSILAVHKESKDTVAAVRFNKLDPLYHGENKYSIAKTMIATDNVSSKEILNALKGGYGLYTGVVEGYEKIVEVIAELSKAHETFELVVMIDGKVFYTDKKETDQAGDDLINRMNDILAGTFNNSGQTLKGHLGLHPTPSTRNSRIYQAPEKEINKDKNKKKITFDDVIGMTEVKEKLYDVIDQINNKEKYEEWNIQPIRGILLHGPSGTGKSYISEALANEVNAKFIKKSAGDIVSKYIGESGQNIKKIFEEARSYKGNSIIFMDEIDAIASKRSGEDNNKERNSTLNELLVQMSSPDNDNVFMIFATNLIELLDPAFLRSGRCDFKIEVPLPDFEMRKGILESTSKGRPLAEGLDFARIARNMSGMNCADVAHISNEAARTALKAKKSCVEEEDYDKAYEVMACGSSSKTTKLSEQEKRITATHEIGHFFMNYKLDLRKAKKISILPRGSALGFVLYANEKEDDKFISTKEELKGRIMTVLAGRAIEEVMLGVCGTGASNDLEVANDIARNIVCKYAFNGSLLVYDNNDIMSRPLINKQVSEILDECYTEVKIELTNNKELLSELIEYLYNKEDVTGDELIDVINAFDKKVVAQ